MARLPMVQRLAVLAAFQATVAIAYFSIIKGSVASMARLPMVQRLAVLAAFQATVAIAYFSIIERSRAREGSFERDGYNFWDMYGDPNHKREQKLKTEKNESVKET